MSLRPNQTFNLILTSAALALLAEGVLLWQLGGRASQNVAQNASAAPPRFPVANAANISRFAPPPAQIFVAPGVVPKGGVSKTAPNAPATSVTGNFAAPFSASKSAANPKHPAPKSSEKGPSLSAAQAQLAKSYFAAGSQALAHKDSKTAIENFRRVAQIAPDHLPTRLDLALLYLGLNRPAEAVPHLQKAAALDPKNPAPRFQLARAYLALRRPDLALAPLQETVRLAPQERAARALLAQVYGAQKRFPDAYAQWSALAKSEPRDVDAALQAANLAAALKLPREAEKWLSGARIASPKDPRPALLLAQLWRGQNQPKRAAQILDGAAKTNAGVFEIYPALADARLASGDLKGAQSALQTALARLPKGTTDEQKARIARAEGELHLSMGRVLGQSKQPKAARAEFERAARLLTRDAEPNSLLALAALQSGDKKTAQSALQHALQLDPKRASDRLTLAQLLAQNGDFKGAQTQFALYAAEQPRDLNALSQWVQVEMRLKQPEKAVQILDKIAALAPKNPLPWLQSGTILREQKSLAPALSRFERALALGPSDAGALFEVARLQSALKKPGAVASWQQFIAKKPDFLPAYSALLEASARGGNEVATRLFLASHFARGAENPRALSEVLRFYAQNKREAQAKALLTDIVKRNPKNKTARAALDSYGSSDAAPTPASPETPRAAATETAPAKTP